MLINTVDAKIEAIVSHFDQNIAMSDELPKYINSLDLTMKELVRKEFLNRLQEENYLDKDKKCFDAKEFYDATACEAKDEDSARAFFQAVYAYAFEGGEEPEVEDFEEDY